MFVPLGQALRGTFVRLLLNCLAARYPRLDCLLSLGSVALECKLSLLVTLRVALDRGKPPRARLLLTEYLLVFLLPHIDELLPLLLDGCLQVILTQR